MNALARLRRALPALLLVLATFGAYYPAIRGGFIWDDDRYILDNPLLTVAGGLRRIWTFGETEQYYPLTYTAFWLEHRAWGFNPLGYHLVNVGLHTLNALLLCWLLKRLKAPGAWFAAAVFALHPVNVESVAWITERKNVLSGFFYLSAAACYFLYKSGEKPRFYAAALALFLLALLSKTVACTLPVALLLVLWRRRERIGVAEIKELSPFFALGAGIGLLTPWLERHRVGATGPEFELSWAQRLLVACRALWFYAGKIAWPANLSFVYPRWRPDAGDPTQWLWVLAAGLAALAAWRWRRRLGRGRLLGLGFFAVTLFPALGFFNVYPFRFSFVADHFQYLASSGLIAALACAAAGLAGKRTPAVAFLVLALLARATWSQGSVYKDQETLWRDVLSKNPRAFIAHTNLAGILVNEGKHEEAVPHYLESLRLYPQIEDYVGLGVALGRAARADAAFREMRAILGIDAAAPRPVCAALAIQESREPRSNPRYVEAFFNVGNAFAVHDEPVEAAACYGEVLRLNPANVDAHYNLGVVLSGQGRHQDAIGQYAIALRLAPGYAQARAALARYGIR